jgi:UDP-GlcNAc3NAcA epimerase
VEIVENGNGIISDADKENILKAYQHFKSKKDYSFPPVYGNGKAAEFICKKILET